MAEEIKEHRLSKGREKFLELKEKHDVPDISKASKLIAKKELEKLPFKTLRKYIHRPKTMISSHKVPKGMTTDQMWESLQVKKEKIQEWEVIEDAKEIEKHLKA